jgi:hypothetical protein
MVQHSLDALHEGQHSSCVSKLPLYFLSKSWTVSGDVPFADVAVDIDGSDTFLVPPH